MAAIEWPEHPHAGADPHVFEHRHLRIDCPGCGPEQLAIIAYEGQGKTRLTGATNYLVVRCGGCGAVQPGSGHATMAPFSPWPKRAPTE